MADDTTTTDTFPDAATMRDTSRNSNIISNEITSIENAIKVASSAGKFSCTVTNSTMTSSSTGTPYFRVWQDLDSGTKTSYDQYSIFDQMQQVISNFQNLGYGISRIQADSLTTFYWSIQW